MQKIQIGSLSRSQYGEELFELLQALAPVWRLKAMPVLSRVGGVGCVQIIAAAKALPRLSDRGQLSSNRRGQQQVSVDQRDVGEKELRPRNEDLLGATRIGAQPSDCFKGVQLMGSFQ